MGRVSRWGIVLDSLPALATTVRYLTDKHVFILPGDMPEQHHFSPAFRKLLSTRSNTA